MSYTGISFPSLGLQIDPSRTLEIGPLTIHYYGIVIGLGLLLAVIYGLRRSKEFGIKNDDIYDGVLWIVPVAVICARAYYCIFSWDEFAGNPISVLYIWNGGLAIYGAVIGAAIGIVVFCRARRISLPAALDIASLGFLIGQSIGRWGNFFNREAFGSETNSFLRMGLYKMVREDGAIVSSATMHYFHPTFLYESLWNALGFILLHFLSKKRKFDGQIALCYALWYGAGRAMIEGLRTDSLYIGPLRVSQMLALLSAAAAAIVLICQARRPHDPSALYKNRMEQ